ncbi:MAG: SPOR domain-containing protein [Oceanicoccus sp.]|uniref:SPOR domain-containing protein n=1 Tax=Oceanicoccus sp. TaxID=2691044 RepID=UPI002619BD66|nr:SPOR domain-containing protein [Oceanicoccus sp.]MCP3907855.1 SPOR domain-containing protein [Oceanicoccus sp.]MDG1772310.1 SPOR domain-containing protein [Oceanicoccus sp.]
MTHDFAKKPKATKKKKSRKTKSQVPGWVWLFTGIVTGLFISFLAYLADITPEDAPEEISNTVEKAADDVKTIATQFDFYTLLPEREVIVEVEREDSSGEPAAATVYILQAGSFKNAEDGDRLRAQLILMGLDARVEAITSANGDVWHRVQVGPFEDRSQLAKARGTLIDKGIDTLLLKRKAEG